MLELWPRSRFTRRRLTTGFSDPELISSTAPMYATLKLPTFPESFAAPTGLAMDRV